MQLNDLTWRIRFVTVFVLLGACSLSAADPDPRLATVRKVFIVAADDLSDDQGVAVCLADRLTAPFEVVKTNDEADVVIRVKAHIPSKGSRVLLGSMGGTPSATIEAQLPDGTKLWSDGAKFRRLFLAATLLRDHRQKTLAPFKRQHLGGDRCRDDVARSQCAERGTIGGQRA